ncbi:nitroreductase [Limnobacter sp.]|uniref:nitroreductase n=1 Tax=Limnobacter sp. TaxID=2003368 RepID=UPI0035140A3C
MEFLDTLKLRHSVRAFDPKPVPTEVLDQLLSQAALSPSWSNTHPYRLALATGPVLESLRQELYARFQETIKLQRGGKLAQIKGLLTRSKGIPDGDVKPVVNYPKDLQPRRVECGKGLYGVLGVARNDLHARDQAMAENFRMFGAPAAVFVFVHEGVGIYSALDAGIYLQSLMLAATNAGLGTCAQGALGLFRSPLDKHFDIPKQYKLLCGVAIGYELDVPVNKFQPEKISARELMVPLRAR